MNILLIEDDPKLSAVLRARLEAEFSAEVQEVPSLQAAIELLEGPWEAADLLICDYHGTGSALLKCLLGLCPKVPCIFVVDENTRVSELYRVEGAYLPEAVKRPSLPGGLIERIALLKKRGMFKDKAATPDSDYVRVPVRTLIQTGRVEADIHIRLSANRYCKLFRKDDQYDLSELERYFHKKGIAYFYILHGQYDEVLKKQLRGVEKLVEAPTVNPVEAREAAESAFEVVQDLSSKMGFTPEVQALALKSVDLTVKVLGKKPNLATILENMKKTKGKYLTSHSIMLAEISCAIACRIGWKSAPTFLKLTLAAFLHDLSIKDNDLAKCRTLEEAAATCHLKPQELLSFKLHPAHSAEYARKFHEIPPDVDSIIAQHHERPDGQGFPRGLFANRISPLSCLFIMAEDMLHYFIEKENGATISQFVIEHGNRYQSGAFRKIIHSLATGVEIGGDAKIDAKVKDEAS